MFSGGEIKTPASGNCWESGNKCKDQNDYPACVDKQRGKLLGNLQGYMDISDLPLTDKQVSVAMKKGWSIPGALGVCRSAQPFTKKIKPKGSEKEITYQAYQYFTYMTYVGSHGGLALYNMLDQQIAHQFGRDGIALTAGEMKMLAEQLKLTEKDFKCVSKETCPGLKPGKEGYRVKGYLATGEYVFAVNYFRLKTLIARLKALNADGVSRIGGEEKRTQVLSHLEQTLKETPQHMTKKGQEWQSKLTADGVKAQAKLSERQLNVALYEKTGIAFTEAEVKILKEKLRLRDWDIVPYSKLFHNGKEEPTSQDGRKYYFFILDYKRMQSTLEEMKEVDLSGIPAKKLAELKTHLADVRDQTQAGIAKIGFQKNDENMERIEAQGDKNLFWILMGQLLFIGVIMREDIKKAWQWASRAGLKGADYRKHVQRVLKENPDFKVIGRTTEAREAWGRTDNPDFRGIIIDANTGEGKDATAEAMLVLKETKDPSVPKDILDAPVLRISAADFQAGTKYRGTVADKIVLLKRMAKRGKVVLYISEIDVLFASGGTSEGNSERAAQLLLDTLEEPDVKRNLVVIGTTSRGGVYTPRSDRRPDGKLTMLDADGDLERRFNWLKLHSYTLPEVVRITTAPDAPFRLKYEKHYGVEVPKPVMESIVKVAEHYYRDVHRTLARIPAVQQVINIACRKARDAESPRVTLEHVHQGISELLKLSIDRTEFSEAIARDAAELERPMWDGSKESLTRIQRGEHTTSEIDEVTRRMIDELHPKDKTFVEELIRDNKPTYDAILSRFDPRELSQLIKVSRIHFESCDGQVKQFHVQQSRGMAVADIPTSFIVEVAETYSGSDLMDMAESTDAMLAELHARAKPVMVSESVARARDAASLKTAVEGMVKKVFPEFEGMEPAGKAQFLTDLLKTHGNEHLRRAYFPDGKITEQGIKKFANAFFNIDLGRIEEMMMEKDPSFSRLRPQRRMIMVKMAAGIIAADPALKGEFLKGGAEAIKAVEEARRRSARKAGGPNKVGVMLAAAPRRAVDAERTATPKGEGVRRGEGRRGEGIRGPKAK